MSSLINNVDAVIREHREETDRGIGLPQLPFISQLTFPLHAIRALPGLCCLLQAVCRLSCIEDGFLGELMVP
jgi:hypothetical protein